VAIPHQLGSTSYTIIVDGCTALPLSREPFEFVNIPITRIDFRGGVLASHSNLTCKEAARRM